MSGVFDSEVYVRDCYAELGSPLGGLSPMTSDEQELLLESAHDEKYAEWLGLP